MKEQWNGLSKKVRYIIIGVVVILALAVVGNMLPDDEPEPETEAKAESTPSVTADIQLDEPTPTETAVVEPPADVVEPTPLDSMLANPLVTGVANVGDNNWEVLTTIVDPRGDAGSPEAVQAVALCEEAKALVPADPTIKVLEEDGTTFAVTGIPSQMFEDPSACNEY